MANVPIGRVATSLDLPVSRLAKFDLVAATAGAFVGFDVLEELDFALTPGTSEAVDEDVTFGKLDLGEAGTLATMCRQKADARIIFAYAPAKLV
jgi:hypothetical protein